MFKVLLALLFTLTVHAEDFYPLHSHNDYFQKVPFWTAFENKFQSVEADIWTWGGKLYISHAPYIPWSIKGTLVDLYLDPLHKMINGEGPVVWPKTQITLWIDLKDIRPRLVHVLARTLSKYPMIGKEVNVVLTGLNFQKRRFLRFYPDIPVKSDASFVSDENLSSDSFSWYSLEWKCYFSWNGKDEMPKEEWDYLVDMVNSIHVHGKKVRIYGTPDNENVWKVLKKANVDLIDSAEVEALRNFWESSSSAY